VSLAPSAEFTNLDTTGLEEILGGKLSVLSDRFHLDWPNGDFFEFRRNGDTVHIDYVWSQQGKSRITQLACEFSRFCFKRGIEIVTASAEGQSATILEKVGMVSSHGVFRGATMEGSRVSEYAAWKEGLGPKPDWRAV
jgi:hypothetical protein